MKSLQKVGAVAALYEAGAYILGIVFYMLVVDYAGATSPLQKVVLLVENTTSMYVFTLLIFVFFGIFLVVLVVALYERLKTDSPSMAKIAAALGVMWATVVVGSGMIFNIGMENVVDLYSTDPGQAATVWLAIDSVFDGLGGGNEIIGGVWILIISVAALRIGEFARLLNYLGLIVGAAGILSAIPSLGEIGGAVFGFGQIVWFVFLGILMLRSDN